MGDAPGRLLLGVDGGNTKTVALVGRPDGTIVGAARRLACADPYAVGMTAATDVVRATAGDALRQAGATDDAVSIAACSMAGADWPEDIAELEAAFGGVWPVVQVVNDAIGALRAAVPAGPGVVVVAGTGAATGARGPDGGTWHSSFWQEPQGARELAFRTIRAIVRAELGIAPPTRLTGLVLAATGDPDVETVLHRQTRRGPDRWTDVDGLASVLLDAAAEGDGTAQALVREQGEALGRTALAAVRRVGIRDAPFPLALTGGLFRHAGTQLADALIATVRAERPAALPGRAALPPVAGALLLAFDAAGIAADDGVAERLHATLEGDALYDTRRTASPSVATT